MALSLPASPTVGQLSVQNGRTYTWSGYAWELTLAAIGTTTAEYAATTAFPSPGVAGILYVATDTAKTYRWTGNSYAELGPVGGSVADTRWDLFLPAAPTSVTAFAGNALVTVSWTAPTVLAQTPITDYTVQYSTNSGSSWTTVSRSASTATSAVVTGLTNETSYVFRVAAVNGVGTGSYSTASSAATPASYVFRAIPVLTSATSSGVASASATLNTQLQAWRAFDKTTINDNTYYASPGNCVGHWIQYDFGSGVYSNIGGYSITSRYNTEYGDSTYGESQAPVSWTFSGSNNGTDFVVLDTRTNYQSFTSNGQPRTFTLSAAANYRIFRWTWTANTPSTAVVIPKLQLVSP